MQPIVEVAAEGAALHGLRQVPIRRRDDSRLASLRVVAAHGFELAGLDHAEQVRLVFEPERVDFVQQNGAFAGGGELADLRAIGTGERTLRVAEELAGDQIPRERAARDDEEAVRLACGAIVNQLREEGLARAGFALDQHGHVVGRGNAQLLDHRGERGRVVHELAANLLADGFRGGVGEAVAGAERSPGPDGEVARLVRPNPPTAQVRVQMFERLLRRDRFRFQNRETRWGLLYLRFANHGFHDRHIARFRRQQQDVAIRFRREQIRDFVEANHGTRDLQRPLQLKLNGLREPRVAGSEDQAARRKHWQSFSVSESLQPVLWEHLAQTANRASRRMFPVVTR